mgnify:CR=1 FL=1
MPMYEKGSVRAEPRSKQQERMKKIMKKFLSSLLALTMILSLVIVPANAADSITATASSIKVGETTTLTAFDKPTEVTVEGTKYTVTSDAPTYNWTSGTPAHATVPDDGHTSNTVVVTGVAAGNSVITCTMTVSYTIPAHDQVAESTAQTTVSDTYTVTVTDPQAAFEAAVKQATVTFKGRTYSANSGTTTFAIDLFGSEALPTSGNDMPTISVSDPYKSTTLVYDTTNSKWVAQYGTGGSALSCDVTLTATKVTPDPTVTITNNLPTNTNAISGQEVTLTAHYTHSAGKNITYTWSASDGAGISGNGATATWKPAKSGAGQTVTVVVKEGSTEVTRKTETYTVDADTYQIKAVDNKTSYTVTSAKSITIKAPYLIDTANNNDPVSDSDVRVTWDKHSSRDIDISSSGNDVTVTGKRTNNSGVKLTATLTYKTKTWTVDYTVYVSALDGKLDEVVNGSSLNFDLGDLEKLAENAVYKVDKTNVTIKSVRILTLPTSSDGVVYSNSRLSSKVSVPYTVGSSDELYFDAADGFLGTASMTIEATDSRNNRYNVTVNIPVVGDKTIKDTVTGTSAGKSVTFTNSDYKYLYYTTSKVTDYTGHFDGTSESGYTLVKEDKDITITASQFDKNGKVTLYVVGVDKDGVASTGTIIVSQKSYDINYNVVAGKSVTFNQKDFESFLEDYAEDNGNYNSRKDEISFDHAVLTSSIPSAKSEGTLYYGSTEITSSNKSKTDMTDMDKVSFDSVSKPSKGTVTLTFKVYGDLYKNGSSKKTEVKYDVNVVISVVKEDITYTVGIDDTVQLTARDFVNFLQDAKTSYRKSTLDYVKFDVSGKNVSSYAYGGLYRSYSSYSTGKLADSTDKFYYEPSRTQYDLADVAYHTTRWAEAGKTVYIPFTVYGTKNEEASGTMAITIAQTMNFIDVKASDFFYEPVKWAVNNKITNGTSSTTFSPYKNCNRAEIVTFLWRAAGSPEPTVTRNPFTDVNSVRDASYYKAILWASQKGITAGTNATTFSPYQECTRSQIVTFLYRYAGKPSGYYSNPFKDVSSVNEASYYNAILWAVGKGITQGTSTTTFSPYASCTRGEAVTFLYRYVNGVK